MSAHVVDYDMGQRLVADFEAQLQSISAAMWRELAAYAAAFVDPASRSAADVAVITDRAIGLVDAAKARFDSTLEIACWECERRFFDRAPLQ